MSSKSLCLRGSSSLLFFFAVLSAGIVAAVLNLILPYDAPDKEAEEGDVEEVDVDVKVPWAGDGCKRVRDAVGEAKINSGEEAPVYGVTPMRRARSEFERLAGALKGCARGQRGEEEGRYGEADARLGVVWEALARTGGGVGNIASQFIQCVFMPIHSLN